MVLCLLSFEVENLDINIIHNLNKTRIHASVDHNLCCYKQLMKPERQHSPPITSNFTLKQAQRIFIMLDLVRDNPPAATKRALLRSVSSTTSRKLKLVYFWKLSPVRFCIVMVTNM